MKKLDALMLANPSFYIRVNSFPNAGLPRPFFANLIDSKDDLVVEINGQPMVWDGMTVDHATENLYKLAEHGA